MPVESTDQISLHDAETPEYYERAGKSHLISRVILFQFKLFADGVRDVVLSPLSIAAGVFGILFSRNDPHRYFDRLLHMGQRSDAWINLFDNHGPTGVRGRNSTMDDLAKGLEEALRKDYQSNGVTAKTVRKMEDIIAEMKRRQRN